MSLYTVRLYFQIFCPAASPFLYSQYYSEPLFFILLNTYLNTLCIIIQNYHQVPLVSPFTQTNNLLKSAITGIYLPSKKSLTEVNTLIYIKFNKYIMTPQQLLQVSPLQEVQWQHCRRISPDLSPTSAHSFYYKSAHIKLQVCFTS